MLTPTPRTILRLFLLFGGIGILWLGYQDDNTPYIALGILAAALGAVGLLWEIREAKRDEPSIAADRDDEIPPE